MLKIKKFLFRDEVVELKKRLNLKEKEIEILQKKLMINEEEIITYINNIFEQQEKERIVKSISDKLRSSLKLDIVTANALKEIRSLVETEENAIYIFDEKNKCLNSFEEINDCPPQKIMMNQLSSEVMNCFFKRKEQFVDISVENFFADAKLAEDFKSINVRTFTISPINYNGNFLGVILIYAQKVISKSQKELLISISNQLAVAVYQAQLFEILREKSKEEKTLCEEAQKHNKLKSDFLAKISHELRTPLNAIIGFSEILSTTNNQNLTEKQLEYIFNILTSGKYLLNLINDILDLSKIESGNCELNKEPFDNKTVIYEVISILSEIAYKKNLKIKLEVEKVIINADKKKFTQIMYNLLSNAIKFSNKDGEIIVRNKDFGQNLYVEVIDNGIGILEEHKYRIFNEFFSYSKVQEGTGLGLPLTKKFIELHGGQIDFESTENEGSRFWLVIPKGNIPENL